MSSDSNSRTPAIGDDPVASRRDFVAAAATVTAAAGAVAAAGAAQAQGAPTVRRFNPPGMSSPPAYHHVVEVNGPHRVIYIAGQTGVDANGKVAESFQAQAVQVLENIKAALAGAGAGFEHIVKLNSYLVNIAVNQPLYRDVRAKYFPDKAALPASTSVGVTALAQAAYLIEVECIAVLPPRA
jgi:enamine deaminase RidA (YjgF/YER057c/UK114 family)